MASDPSPQENVTAESAAQKPYLTPAEVSDAAVAPGLFASKRMWIGFVGALVVAGGALATFAFRPTSHIQNFGNMQRRPVEMEQYVEDFGLMRGGAPVEFDEEGETAGSEAPYEVTVPDFSQKQAPTQQGN